MKTCGIYNGTVVHRRLKPKGHLLKYQVFSLLIDLDALDEIDTAKVPLSINRFGFLSFFESDHGDGRKTGLKTWALEQLAKANIDTTSARIRVLCYPRFIGYVFNPLTVFFCENEDGETIAILYQVKNTMGENHTYIIPIESGAPSPLKHGCDKAMYVSPFTPMESSYAFSIVPPGDDICVSIQQLDIEGPILNASFTGKFAAFTSRNLRRAIFRHPLMTMKVIAGIHFEALKLWRKGVPFFRHTPQPGANTSIVTTTKETTQSAL